MVYMDNAATTLQKPEEVKEAILYALEHMGNAGRGGTEAALDASRSIYAVREKLADFFNAESPTRIAFTAILNCDEKGNLSYEEMENAVRDNTKAIVCTHASNLTGNMINLKRVGQIASKKHILFVVDASQTAGVYPIDVQELGVDVLCFTGHNFCVEEVAWILITCIIRPRCRRHLRPELLMGMGLQDLAQRLII